jgi:hypothetical protein
MCLFGVTTIVLTTFGGCAVEDSATQATAALRSKVGYLCTVQFRRDALGAAGNPVPPTTGTFNGAETQLSGLLKDIKGDYLVLEVPRQGDPKNAVEYWIPRHSVLLLEWSSRPGRVG